MRTETREESLLCKEHQRFLAFEDIQYSTVGLCHLPAHSSQNSVPQDAVKVSKGKISHSFRDMKVWRACADPGAFLTLHHIVDA